MKQAALSKSEQFFIQSLADHLNNRKTEYIESSEDLDWDEILKYARIHKVEGIEYLQLKSIVPKDKQSSLIVSGLTQFSDSQKKSNALKEIETVFSEKNIPFLIVKGLEVAKLYPAIKERSMGDIDIVVKSADKPRADEALTEIGYKNNSVGFFEWKYDQGSINIELHDHLQYENVTSKEWFEYTEKLWEFASKKDDSSRYELDWNYHLIFLLMHLQKHFENGGVGFRLFIDLVKVCQNAAIDIEMLKDTLTKLNLLRFASTCFAFCERWFDVSMPFAADLTDDFYYSSTKKIVGNGVFGIFEEGMENFVFARIKGSGRFGAIMSRYFPSISFMKEDPRFGYLKKCPMLLPYAWLMRDIYALTDGKLSDETVYFSRFFASNDKVDERNRLLSEWGINVK